MSAQVTAPTTPSRATAVARPLTEAEWAAHPVRLDPDLLLEHDGHGFAGRGLLARVALPDPWTAAGASDAVRTALRGVDVDDARGTGGSPVAFLALPFTPGAAEAFVPAVLVGRGADGAAWELRTDATTEADLCLRAHGDEPDGFELRSALPQRTWTAVVEDAISRIGGGDLDKVVLARAVDVLADRPFVVPTVLARLRALFPSCTTFLVDGFLGATPELLVERRSSVVRAHPLAGTAARSGDPEADRRAGAALLASAKDRHEHALVVDAIAADLAPVCSGLHVPDEPTVVGLRNVLHLATELRGTLGEPTPTVLDLAALLHPTPAVAGTPRAAALDLIDEVEGLARGRYAGPVGWMDATGDGALHVGIRSAAVEGRRATMVSGVGVVAGSDAGAELAETQVKLQAMLAALVRP